MNKTTFLFVLFACLGIYIYGSFSIPLMDIDAAQYASISREMLMGKSYLQIVDLGKDYLDKPPMLFWLSALSMKIFGVSDWAYRIASLLFLGIALYATFKFTLIYYTLQTARLATLMLASCQAFFLIAHDVRTDTMLVGWVMLSIWLLAKWSVENKNKIFYLAIAAIAGGMMTKGPIALVVPVLCFAPHWVLKKEWTFFYKPIYIAGIILLGILLIPMSIGLYFQYDMHPGKLINGIPIQSGLKFYYWTQSFGRYTGENYYHEMSHFSFLLENMLWSFLPWIFIFLWALIYKTINFFQAGLFNIKGEVISFFGFILTYLVLSRSQAQLPHYIFVVFPLAAVITAAHWESVLWGLTTYSKALRIFFKFHLFIFCLLMMVVVAIAFLPFGTISLLGKIILLVMIFVTLLLLFSNQLLGQKWFYISIVLMLGVNSILVSHFYPNLLKYQWGNELAKEMMDKGWDQGKVVLYKIPNSNAFHFYGNAVFPTIQDSSSLQKGQLVVCDLKAMDNLLHQFPKSTLLYQANRFHVTMLTLTFLNPSTRRQELTPYGVLELK